jgi:zinc protease
MTKSIAFVASLGAILLSTKTGFAQASEDWAFQTDKLDNGLAVVTMEDHRVPLVNVQVWYHVGSKDEDPQRQGFAHMFEHMMFRGTEKIGPQDHFRFLNRYGARVNGYTSFDQTVYWETLPTSQLDLALWLEAERMGHLKINEDYFTAEREVVKEERRKNYLNRPFGKLYESLYAAAYTVHPYRWTPIGNMTHLDAATIDELRQFFATYYIPNNATLVVVGDVKHEDVVAKARQYFGAVPRKPDPPRVTAVEPPMTASRQVELTDRAPSPLVLAAWHSPGDMDPESLTMEVLGRILSSGQSSRLYRHLVQGQEIAVNANAYNSSHEQSGLFVVSAVLKPSVEIAAAQKSLLDEVRLILDKGLEPAEFEKARNQVLASYVRAAETVQSRADQLGYAAAILKDPNRVNTDRRFVREMTAEDVMQVARRVFTDNNRVSIVIRPDPNPPSTAEATSDKSTKTDEKIVDKPAPKEMPSGEKPKPADLPVPVTRKLANGMTVAVFRDTAAPSVTVSLDLLIGSKCDPADAAGLASCTLNTMRRGTAKHSGDELAEMIDSRAMTFSASADYDDSSVRLWALREYADPAVEILSEIVRTPTFPAKEVSSFVSRSVAQEAINEKDPGTIANRAFAAGIFGDFYLSRPSEGTSASLKKVTPEAVADFHRRYIAPDVATLVFAGDVDPEAAFSLAEKWFGDWQGKSQPLQASRPPEPATARILLVDRPEATQSEIRIGQVVSLSRGEPAYAPARLLSQLFGESFSGRLNRSLRIEKGLTYGARGYFDLAATAASFRMSTFTRNDRTAAAVQAAIDEVKQLNKSTVTREELDASRDTLIGQFQMGLETPAQVADRWWNLVVWGLPADWYRDYQQKIVQTEDPASLAPAIAKLNPAKFTIVVVGKASEIKTDLEKIAPVQVVRETTEK